MLKQLIVNMAQHETRLALVEDGTIAELFINRQDNNDIAGDIYKGRVQRVLPGMQAAFVDIGMHQAAFIHVNDLIGESARRRTFREAPKEAVEDEGSEAAWGSFESEIPIEDLLKEGQEIMVHVAKSPIGTKGARITCNVSLPGRFLVMMPTSDHIGVSRKIEDETERQRLKEMVQSLRKGQFGYIVRTAAEGIQREKAAYEMGFLENLWENIQEKYKGATAPVLLHKELNVSLRAVRDLLTHEADKLVIDSKDGYNSIMGFLDTFMPGYKNSVELYEGTEPLFEAYNLEGDISRALKRKVWLKSGGYIVIEQTEALVAIDVNTGRYVGKHNLEETILKTNLEAVKEIAYQIRLRDIGGIIIIDFIDMIRKSNQEKVYNALKEALKKDRSKTHVLPISEMGLIQMTRKRIKDPLTSILCEPCIYCDGEGSLVSRRTICYNIYREVLRAAQDMIGSARFTLHVNPEIAERLHGEENGIIISLERIIGKQIVIYPNTQFHLEEFDVFEVHS
ncbi:MAG: Rne/Rng family ribonuclease [Desulfobacterales bacterium]|nr:Rne/Rng family ribonuclease [Desulfobacterales bacterium]